MSSRSESAAATRRDLLEAATVLLDRGGPDAVTLREVGAQAGVTRGAPYRHFANKNGLLGAVAAESWNLVAAQTRALRSDPSVPAAEQLTGALRTLISIGRYRPHLHRLMCTALVGGSAEVIAAAGRYRAEFLGLVEGLVGEKAAGHYGALLLASAYGIADMELSGYLAAESWSTTADDLVDTLVRTVARSPSADAMSAPALTR